MSKDTINPTQNNNMEYTDIEKYFNHIRGQLAWIPLEDEHIKAQVEGTLKSVDELESALAVRVPSSPVMSFEEFKAKHLSEFTNRYTIEFAERFVKTKYEGYLIGRRSIVPELSDEEIEKVARKLAKESTAPDKETPNWMLADIERGLKYYRNWLSQINK